MKAFPIAFAITCIATIATLHSCNNSNGATTLGLSDACAADKENTKVLLTRFDSLDFDVYSNQKWDDLHMSHADDILVHYPDGHTTKGIPDHIKELKPMFAFAPDTKIAAHPVKIGVDNWTAVIGDASGTFTKPMEMNGKTIPPTGKKFHFQMSTVAHWKDGKMIEEYLFYDNAAFMKQIGLKQ